MASFFPHLLRPHAVLSAGLPVTAFPHAAQGSFSFTACGDLPMQQLCLVFCAPDGSVVHRVFPRRVRPRQPERPLRALAWVLLLEYLVRSVLRQPLRYQVEFAPPALRHPALVVRIENLGKVTIVLGSFGLRTTALAPDRPIRNRHGLEGYSERVSVAPGTVLPLYVHAPAGCFALQVMRLGADAETVFVAASLRGMAQDYRADAHANGARWQASYLLAIGADWKSGLYTARLSDPSGASFDITFIVRHAGAAPSAALAVLASTNTWQAYNDWGGASLYRSALGDGLDRPFAFIVHHQRPNPAASPNGTVGHLANAERHVLGWLDTHQIGFDLYADIDLHQRPGLLQRYQTLLINTHSEYWSAAMYQALDAFLAGGGNLVYLSGNGLYWKTVIAGQRIEVRFDHSRHSLADAAGGRWRDCGRPEWRTLGVRFTRAGYRAQYRPYRVIAAQHWIFANTGVRPGDLVGRAGLNCGGASGWEIDKIDPANRPPGLVHLAKGTNARGAGADMVYFPHAGGGAVFSVGSITFGGSLAVDPVLSRMLLNVLARFGQGGKTLPPGSADVDDLG